jgi:Lon protease-like protein
MTRRLPLFPLRTVLFPGGPLSLRIFEPRYVNMVSRCLREGSGFVVVQLLDGTEAGNHSISTAAIGTEAKIVDFDRLEDGLLGLTCMGAGRVRVIETWQEEDGLHMAELDDLPADPVSAVPNDCRHLVDALEHLYPQLPSLYAQWVPKHLDDATWVGNRLAELSPFDASVRQGLMEMTDPEERLRFLAPLVQIDAGAVVN